MAISSLLEAGMMICWGSSWPFQVIKTYTTKDVSGKSILFLWLIEIGYVFGLLYKVFYHFDYVIWLYILNFVLVGADMILYYCYKGRQNLVPIKVKTTIEKKTTKNATEIIEETEMAID